MLTHAKRSGDRRAWEERREIRKQCALSAIIARDDPGSGTALAGHREVIHLRCDDRRGAAAAYRGELQGLRASSAAGTIADADRRVSLADQIRLRRPGRRNDLITGGSSSLVDRLGEQVRWDSHGSLAVFQRVNVANAVGAGHSIQAPSDDRAVEKAGNAHRFEDVTIEEAHRAGGVGLALRAIRQIHLRGRIFGSNRGFEKERIDRARLDGLTMSARRSENAKDRKKMEFHAADIVVCSFQRTSAAAPLPDSARQQGVHQGSRTSRGFLGRFPEIFSGAPFPPRKEHRNTAATLTTAACPSHRLPAFRSKPVPPPEPHR